MRAFIVGVTLLVCTAANAADTTSANVVLPGCKEQGGSFGVGYLPGCLWMVLSPCRTVIGPLSRGRVLRTSSFPRLRG
jgi:hypothetical protein